MSIEPICVGIISDPPLLLLTYDEVKSPSSRKCRRQRRMPVRHFTDRSDVHRMYFVLKQRHDPYLSCLPSVTVLKLLRVVQEVMKGLMMEEAVDKVNAEFDIDPEQDLNKVSVDELAQKKEIMDEGFYKRMVKPGDPAFVYDKQEDFGGIMGEKKQSDWDEEDDYQNVQVLEDKDEKLAKLVEDDDDDHQDCIFKNEAITLNHVEVKVTEDKVEEIDHVQEESMVEVAERAEVSPPEENEEVEDVPLDEQVLLSICDGEIDENEDDMLLSFCDFTNISLPFGDGDNFSFLGTTLGDDDEVDVNDAEIDARPPPHQDSPQRHRLYLCVGESDDVNVVEQEDNDDDQVLPHTVIDIGTSSFFSETSVQEETEEDDKMPPSLRKEKVQKNVDDISDGIKNLEAITESIRDLDEAESSSDDDKNNLEIIVSKSQDQEMTTPSILLGESKMEKVVPEEQIEEFEEKVVIDPVSYTVIDLGTSFLSDPASLHEEEDDEKESELFRNFPQLKLEVEKNVDELFVNAVQISERMGNKKAWETTKLHSLDCDDNVEAATSVDMDGDITDDKQSEKVAELIVPHPSLFGDQEKEEENVEIMQNIPGESTGESMEKEKIAVAANKSSSKADNQINNQLITTNNQSVDLSGIDDDEFWCL